MAGVPDLVAAGVTDVRVAVAIPEAYDEALDLTAEGQANSLGLGRVLEGRKLLGERVDLRVLDVKGHIYPNRI